jgi:hypothetical protein
VAEDLKYKSDNFEYLLSRLVEGEYNDCGLTFEKYCIFLKEVESDKVERPTFEKSSKLILELLEEGDNIT